MLPAEALTLRYALHELPPGRLPFRRWRWELWHGPRLEATGWSVSEAAAARMVRRYASVAGHRLLGVPRRADSPLDYAPFKPGASLAERDGALLYSLVPLQLEVPAAS